MTGSLFFLRFAISLKWFTSSELNAKRQKSNAEMETLDSTHHRPISCRDCVNLSCAMGTLILLAITILRSQKIFKLRRRKKKILRHFSSSILLSCPASWPCLLFGVSKFSGARNLIQDFFMIFALSRSLRTFSSSHSRFLSVKYCLMFMRKLCEAPKTYPRFCREIKRYSSPTTLAEHKSGLTLYEWEL